MFSTHSSRFLFSDYDCFVRLVFLAAVLLLEPFNSRFRFRERFYRTAHESPIAPAPDAVQVVKPLPRKMVETIVNSNFITVVFQNIDEMTPNYGNAPPAYDDAQSLPTSWTITPPSKEYTGAQMTPVEAK